MRAAIYARHSTHLQSHASIKDQLRLCRGRIEAEGRLPVNDLLSGSGRIAGVDQHVSPFSVGPTPPGLEISVPIECARELTRTFRVAEIELSPNVADPFVRMDWHDDRGDPVGFRAALIRNYELGKVIVLENAPFDINFDVLNKVSLPCGRRFQKLSDKFFRTPKLHRADVRRLLYTAFGIDVTLYLAFSREVRRLSASLRDFARDVFRPYRFLKLGVSWRFTSTGPEGLHVDYFRNDEDLHYLRIFMNVDNDARVWTLSHQLEELIRRYYDEARLLQLADAPSNAVCSRLNKVVFDHVNALPRGAMDRHVVRFAPGEVWLCETRLNSHEIYSGHRLVATDFYVDSGSMLDPSQRVDARVRRALEQGRRGAAGDVS